MDEQEVFAAALQFDDSDARARYLDQACAADSALRNRLDALLRAHDEAGSFLLDPALAGKETRTEEALPAGDGAVIGPYKLLQLIGEGGMGTVYMAEQSQPVKRMVALKIIKAGMDSRQVLARFDAERQALALMDHPNIARVFDAGTTAGGRPYFVMELVKGPPITGFCDQQKLTVRERLELFIPVCQAVQHAHQKGIIHRDLKPSNVLIASYDGRPVPKIIDFGVAKAAGPQLTDKTLFTEFGSVVGTPSYMSPEQATLNQIDIDTRSDIYSLGVVLYELLTGTTPLDARQLRGAAILEVLRVVREEEPPRPSTRLSTTQHLPAISACRGVEPGRLSGMVRGELDWIVMKALEKDRSRRYETANGLAADLQRFLRDEPVSACPPGAWYRVAKVARRNMGLLTAVAVVFLVLTIGAAVATWQAIRATQAEREALAQWNRAEENFRMARDAVDRSFLQASESPVLKSRGMERFRRDQLLNAREFYERFARRRSDAPEVRHDLGIARSRLAEIDRDLGNYPEAEESATQAIALLGALTRARPGVAEYQRNLAAAHLVQAQVYSDTERWEKAEAAFGLAVAMHEQQAAADPQSPQVRLALAKTLTEFGFTLQRAEHLDGAIEKFRRVLTVLRQNESVRVDDVERRSLIARANTYLGQVSIGQGRYEQAEVALTDAARTYGELIRERPDPGPGEWQALARSQTILGRALCWTGKFQQAEDVQNQALPVFERLAREHPDVTEFTYDLGRCIQEMGYNAERSGREDTARARYERALDVLEDASAKGYLRARTVAVTTRTALCGLLARQGAHARATDEADALGRREGLGPVNIYDIACVFSLSAAAAGRDPALAPAERERLRARYADRAMDYLRRAVARGYRRPDALKKDSDIDAIRDRDDFRRLLADLEAEQAPRRASTEH